ncbi:LORF2 protein, partial [Crocuta crocuta]
KKENNKCWQGRGEIGTFVHSWWECKTSQPPWETVCQFLKKLNIELPSDLAIPLQGTYPTELKMSVQKNTRTHMFIIALCPITKRRNDSNVHQRINELWYIHTME